MLHKIKNQKLNKTFARRVGKRFSLLSQNLIDNELPKFQYIPKFFKETDKTKIFIEIGFGMGEHFLHLIKANKNDFFIGVEVYLNGVAHVLKKAKEISASNFLIWPSDLDFIMYDIPPKSIDGIYILFPDPWHKRRQRKKRLFNEVRLKLFKKIIKSGGMIIFASDIDDYFDSSKKLIASDSDFIINNTNYIIPPENYIITKYHQKAILAGRSAQFIEAILK